MKRVSVVFLCLISAGLSAQNEADVIRYSMETLGSTARSFGVAGAFGSIGADASCASINPAGLARFRTSNFFVSSSFYTARNNAGYIGEKIEDSKFNFNLPNIGIVANIRGEDYESKNPEGFVNFVIGFNVNRLNNFHKRSIFDADNRSSSVTENWAERATETGTLPPQFSRYSLEHLAYSAWVIDKDTSSPVPAYVSAYGKNSAIHVNQRGSILTRGALNDYNFSFAGNYRHIVLVGISLGAKSVRYIEDNSFTETDKRGSPVRDINNVTLEQYLRTSGIGFNAKLGVNVSPTEYFRMGYAFHSPTIFNLTDSYLYTIQSKFDFGARDPLGDLREEKTVTTESTVYKYKITTPARHVFSLGLVNKEMGFISLDIETVNYSSGNIITKDKGADAYSFTAENLSIKRKLSTNVVNIRLGGEAIWEQYRFRAGYARYPSQYKSGEVPFLNNLVNNVYTLGFGIKSNKYSFDAAYVNSGYADYSVPYTLQNPAKTSYTITNNVRSTNIVLSASINID
jgi:hypothetical protein